MRFILPILLMGVIFTISFTTNAKQDNPKGCIAVFQATHPISVEVELPKFEQGLFQTKQFHFANLPKTMQPNAKGSYCYPMNDERFHFVHVYYYAVKQIEDYNRIFLKLEIPLGKTLAETVEKGDPGFPTGGWNEIDKGEIDYPGAPADPSLIQHEIGHWVAANAAGRTNNRGAILAQSSADMLAVLHSGNTMIGKHDAPGVAYDIDTYIHVPDKLVLMRQLYVNAVQDLLFAKKFAKAYEQMSKTLQAGDSNPDVAKYLNSPDPDINASAINQPLWQAALIFGFEPIKLIYVKMLAAFKDDHDYSFYEIAQALISNARDLNPELANYLTNAFETRGVLSKILLPLPPAGEGWGGYKLG